MNEIFLMKLGEIVLKGANKRQFENKLRQNVRRRMKHYGNFDVYIMQSTVYVVPEDEMADVDGAWEACHTIFGVVSLCRCRPCEKNIDAIYSADPNKDPNAVRYTQLTYSEALAKNLRATDITAMALAMDNDMTMVCFGLDEENSIIRVVRGEEIGTTVKNEF